MKKAISFVLVWGIIFIPCVGVFAQKRVLRQIVPKRSAAKTSAPQQELRGSNEFESVQAVTSGESVLLQWTMRSEKSNMGFYIHRIDPSGETVINDQIVFGSAAHAGRYPLFGEQYAFLDKYRGFGSAYYIESVDLYGKRVISETFTPVYSRSFDGKAPGVPLNGDNGRTKSPGIQSESIKLTREIVAQREAEVALPDPIMHKWVISHPGARIDVKGEGIYRVPFSQLQAAGFNTGSNNSLWQLYRNGVEQAILVNTNDGYLEFYGQGIDTPETEFQGYFLINGDTAGKRIENTVARPPATSITLPSYNQTSTYKERTLYLDTILNGPAENYWGRGICQPTVPPAAPACQTGVNLPFDLTGIDFSSPNATLDLKIQGFSQGIHNIRITLNGHLLNSIIGISQLPFSGTQTIPTSILKDASLGQGPNVLNLASVGLSDNDGDFNLFDTVSVTFARKHTASQNTLKAYTASNKRTQLSGFSSANVHVWDITFENDPRVITNLDFQNQGGTFGTVLGSVRGRVIYAADESQIKGPFAVSANDGEILETNTLDAEFIVISYKDFMPQAQTWANYRIGQGFSAKVVNIDEIFNEFNFGNQSSDAIERFLEYTYNNWNAQPKYVLIIGDATRDPRNYSGNGYFNYVPSRMVTTIFTETGSDEALADFDNDGLAEIAIGRIPARVTTDVDNVFQKVTNWEANLLSDPISRGSLFATDQYDASNDIDFPAITERVKDELPVSMTKTVVARSQPNAQADLIAAFNTGKYIVNYTGHGATGTWAAQSFFWLGNVTSLTNHNSESIVTMLTCLNGYFLFPVTDGLAERLLSSTNGGAVATWASTGLTTPDVQEVMARRFYKKIGDGDIPRIGDLIKDAKTAIVGGTDVRHSWALLGDPMLKVR